MPPEHPSARHRQHAKVYWLDSGFLLGIGKAADIVLSTRRDAAENAGRALAPRASNCDIAAIVAVMHGRHLPRFVGPQPNTPRNDGKAQVVRSRIAAVFRCGGRIRMRMNPYQQVTTLSWARLSLVAIGYTLIFGVLGLLLLRALRRVLVRRVCSGSICSPGGRHI